TTRAAGADARPPPPAIKCRPGSQTRYGRAWLAGRFGGKLDRQQPRAWRATMALSPAARVGNIGTAERRKRLVFGNVAVGVGEAVAVLLVVARAPLVWRLPLILVFYAGALGVFQARDKT